MKTFTGAKGAPPRCHAWKVAQLAAEARRIASARPAGIATPKGQAIQRRRDVLPSPSTALAATMDYAGLRIAVGTLIAERPRVGTRLPRPLMAFSRQREQRGATFAGSRLVACD